MGEKVDIEKYAIPIEKLRWDCPPEMFQFECTMDIEPLKEFIGQERALASIDFGLTLELAAGLKEYYTPVYEAH